MTHARLATLSLPLLLLATACGDDAPATGDAVAPDGTLFEVRIAAQSGTQNQARALDLDDASTLSLTEVQADGSLVELAQVEVSAEQTVATRIALPDTARFILVEAWSETGDLVAAGVSDQRDRDPMAPRRLQIDAETTLETWVWTDRVARSGDPSLADHVLLRTLIDAPVAAVVYGEYLDGFTIDDEVAALADATLAAQAARDAAWSMANASATGGASIQDVTASASQDLDDALFDGPVGTDRAWTDFYEAIDLAGARAGMTETERVDAASATSLAFRTTLESRDDLSGPFVAQADRGAAMWEAWYAQHTLIQLDGVSSSVVDLSADFWSDARSADDSDALLDAWHRFASALAVSLPGGSRVPVFDPFVDDVINGEIEVLDGDLDEAVDELVDRFESDGDLTLDAERTVLFWSDVRAAVATAVADNGDYRPDDERIAIEMLVHASAAHRVAF